MTSIHKPRTAALIPAGVLLLAAAASPEVLAAGRAQPPAEAGAASEVAPAEAEPAPAADPAAGPTPEPGSDPAAAPAAGAEASAGGGAAAVKVDAAGPKASKGKRRQPPEGVILDEKKNRVRDTRKWIHRYSPERHLFEIGVFGGLNLPPDDHDLYKPIAGKPDEHKPLWRLGPAVGGRLAYFPLRILGIEAEFAAVPTYVRNVQNSPALVYGLRGHAIVQLPYRITPFLLGGYGMLGISSPGAKGLGSDIDPAGHWGGGLKIYISRLAAFRVDARHIISAQAAKRAPQFTNHAQITVGFSLVLGRVRPQPAPKDLDWDKDGILNDVDQCPKLAGDPPDGCPSIDSDGDTFLDKDDKCPFEVGVAPDGCPPPDQDKDGILDADDQCPTEPWPEAPGCPPPPDSDGDKIIDTIDKCPMHPESYNGFEDDDGCPDKVPEVARWDGKPLEGINFETRSDKIKKGSEKTLDRAADVLKQFPSLKIEIQGHTDDVGGREFNLDLSQRRADSVKNYLVGKGVDASRIKTIGYGPDKPIDPAKTSKARAKNRRIEFRVIIDKPAGAASSDDGDAPADAGAPAPAPAPKP